MKKHARSLAVFLLVLPALSAVRCGGVAFDLGVGAFEIGPHAAILWTHVAPDDPTLAAVPLFVEVARDAAFQDLVRTAAVVAHAGEDFTARIRVGGLEPATAYHYRFVVGKPAVPGETSPPGRFRTAPKPDSTDPVRFVISGDSNAGYSASRGVDFYVLSAAAEEEPDFFVYFGDTIYADSGVLPGGAHAFTLDEYRQVHRLTRADPHLQTLLAATGTFTGWDDHEIRNDYDGETVDPVQFENGARAFF